MREIVFRVWNGANYENNVMVGKFGAFYVNPMNGGLDANDSASLSPFNTKFSDNVIIEQFTGLHDATKWEDLTDAERDEWIKSGHTKEEWKGRRIFDGDIVGFTAENELWEPQYYEGTVYFCDGTFWVDCGKDGDDNDVLFTIGHAKLCDESLQIIGNIHNNPEELVEAKS